MVALVPELYCSNIENVRSLYLGILGFKIKYERPENRFIYLEREGAEIMFEELGADREWLTNTVERPFGRGVNFQIKTKNVNQLYDAAIKNNCKIFLDIEEKWYRCNDHELGNRQFIIQDDDGYLLRFFEDLGQRQCVQKY